MAIDSGSKATGTEFSSEIPVELLGESGKLAAGAGPYRLAWRRLRRNRAALAFGGLFLLILVLCLLAPVYAHDIAHTGPNDNHITETIKVGGKVEDVVNAIGLPIGPTWHSRFFLGADSNGRDVAVRLLYGGRNSLEVGTLATLITMVLATIVGVLAGYSRGLIDGILTRALDVIWAYPVVILGVALGAILAVSGIDLGIVKLKGSSLLVPAVVIGIVYVPYVAKPIRGQVLGLREREFIDAARVQVHSSLRIMFSELLPNVGSTVIVFVPMMLANAVLLEAGLSYRGAGVQPPNPSWGTMIAAGIGSIPAAIHLVLVPGSMLGLALLRLQLS